MVQGPVVAAVGRIGESISPGGKLKEKAGKVETKKMSRLGYNIDNFTSDRLLHADA